MKTTISFVLSFLVSLSTAVVFYVAPDCNADVITDVATCQQAANALEKLEYANAMPASTFEAGGCFDRSLTGGVWFNPAGWSSVETEHRICATTITDPSSLWDFYAASDCGSDIIKNADTCRLAAQAISGMTYHHALPYPNPSITGGCIETGGGAVYFNSAWNSLSTSANLRLCASFLGHSQATPLTTTSVQSSTTTTTAVLTAAPTANPTSEPTSSPTFEPTQSPTSEPTSSPTFEATSSPTSEPTSSPTFEPTPSPTLQPTSSPTFAPTSIVAAVTNEPSTLPSQQPATTPSAENVGSVEESSEGHSNLGSSSSSYHLSVDHMALVIGVGFILVCITCFTCDRHRRSRMVKTAKEDATPEGFGTPIDCDIAPSAPTLAECTHFEVDFDDMKTPGEIETTCRTAVDLNETSGEHQGEPGCVRKTIEAEFSPEDEPSLPLSSPCESPPVDHVPLSLGIEKPHVCIDISAPESPKDLPRLRGIRLGEGISMSFEKVASNTLHLEAGESAMTMSSAYESPSAYLRDAHSPSLTADQTPPSFTADGPQRAGAARFREAVTSPSFTADGPQRTGAVRSPSLTADLTPSYTAEGPRQTGATLSPTFSADSTSNVAGKDHKKKRRPRRRTGWESCTHQYKKRSVADFHQRVFE